MIEMKKILMFCMLGIVLWGCHKEKELLTGDVMGKITVYNQDLTASSDNSGVQVSLYSGNSLLDTKLTDSHGLYHFEDIEYGKYSIDLLKDKCIKPVTKYAFNHVGGYSPTILDGSVYMIPDYNLTIDSLKVKDGDLYVYSKIDGSKIIPFSFYSLIGYCGTDQNVSKDNYSFLITGTVSGLYSLYPVTYYNANAVIHYISLQKSPDLIFVRFYLLTSGQSIYSAINKEALGKPSNVTSFIWQ